MGEWYVRGGAVLDKLFGTRSASDIDVAHVGAPPPETEVQKLVGRRLKVQFMDLSEFDDLARALSNDGFEAITNLHSLRLHPDGSFTQHSLKLNPDGSCSQKGRPVRTPPKVLRLLKHDLNDEEARRALEYADRIHRRMRVAFDVDAIRRAIEPQSDFDRRRVARVISKIRHAQTSKKPKAARKSRKISRQP